MVEMVDMCSESICHMVQSHPHAHMYVLKPHIKGITVIRVYIYSRVLSSGGGGGGGSFHPKLPSFHPKNFQLQYKLLWSRPYLSVNIYLE